MAAQNAVLGRIGTGDGLDELLKLGSIPLGGVLRDFLQGRLILPLGQEIYQRLGVRRAG